MADETNDPTSADAAPASTTGVAGTAGRVPVSGFRARTFWGRSAVTASSAFWVALRAVLAGMSGLRRNAGLGAATAVTVAVAVSLAGASVLATESVDVMARRWADGVEFVVYMQPDASETDTRRVRGTLDASDAVSRVDVVSQEDALAEFNEMFAQHSTVTSAVTADLLPSSFKVSPSDPDPEAVAVVAEPLRADPAVYQVVTADDAVRDMRDLTGKASSVSMALTVVLSAVAVVLSAAMIRTSVASRRDEISVMRLVGASRTYVASSFAVEGVLCAAAGAAAAAAALIVAMAAAQNSSSNVLRALVPPLSAATVSTVAWISAAALVAASAITVVATVFTLRAGTRRRSPRRAARRVLAAGCVALLVVSAAAVTANDVSAARREPGAEAPPGTGTVNDTTSTTTEPDQDPTTTTTSTTSTTLPVDTTTTSLPPDLGEVVVPGEDGGPAPEVPHDFDPGEHSHPDSGWATIPPGPWDDAPRTKESVIVLYADRDAASERVETAAAAVAAAAARVTELEQMLDAKVGDVERAAQMYAESRLRFSQRVAGAYVVGAPSGLRLPGTRDVAAEANRVVLPAAVTEADYELAATYRSQRDNLDAEAVALADDLSAARAAEETASAAHLEAQRQLDAISDELISTPVSVPGFVFPVVAPTNFISSYGFCRDGCRRSHQGNDLFAAKGSPVVAVEDGWVERVGSNRLGGLSVWTRGRSGFRYYYAHLSGFADGLVAGDEITAGTLIGYVGNTGNAISTPPHLHFEIRPGTGAAIDPYPMLTAATRITPADIRLPGHPAPTAVSAGQAGQAGVVAASDDLDPNS